MVVTEKTNADIVNCVLRQYVPPDYPMSSLPDPSSPGAFKIKILTYGEKPSASSLSRPDMVAPTVTLPAFLADHSRKFNKPYHQIDSSNLPLKARVWFPEGEGPFPIVVITHGNSNPGFEYLTELLASRGCIVAQVDQTYLNGNMDGENGARGWILLNHLELWRKWNNEEGNLFNNKVDLDRITLIGMSRGGEAVALAATFNQWERIPKTNKTLDFKFGIKAVIGLVPSDKFYLHADGHNFTIFWDMF
jgi:hypothetical protein